MLSRLFRLIAAVRLLRTVYLCHGRHTGLEGALAVPSVALLNLAASSKRCSGRMWSESDGRTHASLCECKNGWRTRIGKLGEDLEIAA